MEALGATQTALVKVREVMALSLRPVVYLLLDLVLHALYFCPR